MSGYFSAFVKLDHRLAIVDSFVESWPRSMLKNEFSLPGDIH